MICPACETKMDEVVVEGVTVDVCKKGCGGIWFDRFELQKISELPDSAGESLVEMSTEGTIKTDSSKQLKCPKCDDIIMMRHFFSTNKEIEVDECPSCSGFWLDCGELGNIQSQHASKEDKVKAANEYFDIVFGEELTHMKNESAEKLKKTKKIARLFRFICPSYYIPGNQDWGAF